MLKFKIIIFSVILLLFRMLIGFDHHSNIQQAYETPTSANSIDIVYLQHLHIKYLELVPTFIKITCASVLRDK